MALPTTAREPTETGLGWRAFTRSYNADRLGFLTALPRRGPVVRMAAHLVFVSDPALIETVFRQTNTDFRMPLNRRLETVGAARGDAALEAWMGARRRSSPRLHAEPDPATRSELAEQVGRWVSTPRPVPVLPDLGRLHLRATARLVTGVPHSALEAGTLALLAPLTEVVDRGTRLRGAPALLSRRHRRSARHDADLQRQVLAELDGSELEGTEPGGLLGDLGETGLDRATIANFAVAMLLAGSVAPAAASAWVLAVLAGHPPWQERARSDPAARSWVISEALRLYPPTWLISRVVARDGTYAGWRLREGDELVVSPYVSHRDPRVFPEPERFLPGRWDGFRPGMSEYFPFGAGARRCVGGQLSLARLDDLVREVLEQTGFLEGGAPERVSTTITLVPEDLRLRFHAS